MKRPTVRPPASDATDYHDEQAILKARAHGSVSIDALVRDTRLPIARVIAADHRLKLEATLRAARNR